MNKPNLPDPGHDRWWEIEADEEADFRLKLMEEDDTFLTDTFLIAAVVVAQSEYISSRYASAAKFETEAREILDNVTKVEAFAGTYKFNGEK